MPNNETIQHADERPQLVHEARQMLLNRWAKYSDPTNEEWVFEDAPKWERHAINALLDLMAVEKKVSEMRTIALREAAEMQCKYCAGTDPDALIEPKFFPKGYVSNFGEIEDTFLHGTTWGGLYQCDAEKIHLAQRAAAILGRIDK